MDKFAVFVGKWFNYKSIFEHRIMIRVSSSTGELIKKYKACAQIYYRVCLILSGFTSLTYSWNWLKPDHAIPSLGLNLTIPVII